MRFCVESGRYKNVYYEGYIIQKYAQTYAHGHLPRKNGGLRVPLSKKKFSSYSYSYVYASALTYSHAYTYVLVYLGVKTWAGMQL